MAVTTSKKTGPKNVVAAPKDDDHQGTAVVKPAKPENVLHPELGFPPEQPEQTENLPADSDSETEEAKDDNEAPKDRANAPEKRAKKVDGETVAETRQFRIDRRDANDGPWHHMPERSSYFDNRKEADEAARFLQQREDARDRYVWEVIED